MSLNVVNQDFVAAHDAAMEEQPTGLVNEYESNDDETPPSLADTVHKNRKIVIESAKPKTMKKNGGDVKSKKRKTAAGEDEQMSSPSAKPDDAGDGSLGESLRQISKSKLIFIDVCKVCSRKHAKFKRHEILEDFVNKMTTFLFPHRQIVEESL